MKINTPTVQPGFEIAATLNSDELRNHHRDAIDLGSEQRLPLQPGRKVRRKTPAETPLQNMCGSAARNKLGLTARKSRQIFLSLQKIGSSASPMEDGSKHSRNEAWI
jgi:hypothetical protein